eukprot:6982504-Pyramimonas_sp.AAC.1
MQSPTLTFTLTSTPAFSLECPSSDTPYLANWLLHKSPPPAVMSGILRITIAPVALPCGM